MKKIVEKLKQQHFLRAFIGFYDKSEIGITSIAVAYYFLISALPLLLVLANILPYFQVQTDALLNLLSEILPDSLYPMVAKAVKAVFGQPSSGLLGFSILSALWAFSKCISFLQKAFNKAYGVTKGHGLLRNRLFSFVVSIGLQILLILSMILSVFGRSILTVVYNVFDLDVSFYRQITTITEGLVFLVLFLTLVALYYLLPNVKINKLRYVLPGTIFVVGILFGLLNLFSAYLEAYMHHFINVRFFGSVVVIIIMLWFIIVSKILIIGAILNASIQSCSESEFQLDRIGSFSFKKKD